MRVSPKARAKHASADVSLSSSGAPVRGTALPKAYNPREVEDRVYALWEQSGAFRPESCPESGEPFCMSMPPPNATGQLHLGHAARMSTEDIFVRFARMQGKRALWVPGTDHAAIATENVVIKLLKEQGMRDPRKELGREKLVARIAEYVEQSKATIRSQIRKMGSSCDWSRERYTFEPALSRCVNEVFVKMYRDGLIYRGHRIVNWDPKLQTTVSDDEVVYKEETTAFYTFQYGPFAISTARPETKFGDKYVVMHPEDKRYTRYKHGETFDAEWINGPVRATVIKDPCIDMEFGTGVMTITPWHDHVDFEIAERHGLEKEQIIDFEGKLLPIAGEFADMRIDDARPAIVEKLKAKGLLLKIDEHYVHRKAVSQRGGGAIEPQIKLQWFIDVNTEVVPWKGQQMSLKQIMHSVVHHGDIRIIHEHFGKIYFHWIDNLRDWCISRQIWWGHRVPVWYCSGGDGSCKEPIVSREPPLRCPHCGSARLEQDQDTLDTWFSSALWTWSTLVEPKLTKDMNLSLPQLLEQSPDFKAFHPTTVMETAYDILFFWVARMILMTTYAVGSIPFKTVYLSGLIRTRDGRKMSKSDPDTAIDPIEVITEYGADALRLSMIVGQSAGNDTRLYKDKIAGYRNFINKLWNASRFVLMQCEKAGIDTHGVADDAVPVSLADTALHQELLSVRADVTKALQNYRLSEAGERLYSFVWDFFCNWYLELSKGETNIPFLVQTLREILQLVHPYCPFVTEELWAHVCHNDAGMLIAHRWPQPVVALGNTKERKAFQMLIDVITAIRKLRADQHVPPSVKVHVIILSKDWHALLQNQKSHICRLAKVEGLTIAPTLEKPRNVASNFLSGVEVHLSLQGAVDQAAEREKLIKEQENLLCFVDGISGRLQNAEFLAKAPPELVAKQKAQRAEAQEKLRGIEERLRGL